MASDRILVEGNVKVIKSKYKISCMARAAWKYRVLLLKPSKKNEHINHKKYQKTKKKKNKCINANKIRNRNYMMFYFTIRNFGKLKKTSSKLTISPYITYN